MVLPSCVESLLLKQNPTLIYLRNVKSFVFRAQGSTLPKMGLPRATAFRFGQGHFKAVFNFYFNSRRDQKRARQIYALERVAILFLGLRHNARNAPSCFKSLPETMKPQKGRKDDTNIHVLNWEGPPLGVQILYTFPTQKWASNKSNSSVTSSCASSGFLRSRLESQSWNSFNPFPIVNNLLPRFSFPGHQLCSHR